MVPFGREHMYIYKFLLRMADIMTSQNIVFPPGTLSILEFIQLYMLSKIEKYGSVVEFGPFFYFSLVHKYETLQRGKKYGNKVSIICTFVSYI
jgi:hypothetical protein